MSSTYTFNKKTVRDFPLHNQRVLVRADFNVPLTESGEIESDYRITQTLPTLSYLLERGCSVVVIAHLGRPEGIVDKKYSLSVVATALKELLPEYSVDFCESTTDDKARQACKKLLPKQLLLLENLRFDSREKDNNISFADSLKNVSGASYFIQDGFGVVHRAHASTEAITHLLPAAAGLLLEKEVTTLKTAVLHPEHPFVVVVGGAKVSDKIGFIEKLLPLVDNILIGGAMGNTFLKQQGSTIGKSKYEENQEEIIATILQKSKSTQIVLPEDVIVSKEIATDSQKINKSVSELDPDDIILDVGANTSKLFNSVLAHATTIIWNGTLGLAEIAQYAQGSAQLAHDIGFNHTDITSIIGGGDTADFVLDWLAENPEADFSHISTGGGASLELMSGLKLPGVEALLNK